MADTIALSSLLIARRRPCKLDSQKIYPGLGPSDDFVRVTVAPSTSLLPGSHAFNFQNSLSSRLPMVRFLHQN